MVLTFPTFKLRNSVLAGISMSTWHNKLREMENKSQRRSEYFVIKKKGMKHCYSLHSK